MLRFFPDTEHRRIDERQTFDLPVDILIYKEPTRSGQVRDMSKGGLLVVMPSGWLERGDELIVDFRCGILCVSTIAWIKPGMVGCAFHRKLGDGDMETILTLQSSYAAQHLAKQARLAAAGP